MSYIGRVNYNMFDVLLFTATLRIDGSSRFGKNNRFGYFPSGAVAWKLHQHDFIKNLNVFSNLKARASFGRTGNQDIGNFLSIVTYGTGAKMVLDGKPVVSFGPQRIANPDLKWETTEQINVGLDMGFFDNRLSVSLDYFQKNTFDMLFNKPIPASTGYTSIMQNVGNIRNRGFELTLDSRNFVGAFTWNTSLNLSTLKNKVTDLSGLAEIIHGDAGQSTSDFAIIREGEALNSFFGYQTAGIWQSEEEIQAADLKYAVKPGDVHYVDQNGDGYINDADRVVLGDSFPDFSWSFGNTFSYKNLDLYVFFEGVQGVEMLNGNLIDNYFPLSFRRNKFSELYLNRWTPENPTNQYPSFVDPLAHGRKVVNSRTLSDASYVRLKTIRLSYTFPKFSKFISSLQVYATAENVFTFTDYIGLDPTVNSNSNVNFRMDFNSYPSARTYMFGVKLDF